MLLIHQVSKEEGEEEAEESEFVYTPDSKHNPTQQLAPGIKCHLVLTTILI
jgi:hypothetical protein